MQSIQTLKELNRKRAKAVARYLQALKQGKTGRSLGAFKGGITRRSKAIALKVKELKECKPTETTPKASNIWKRFRELVTSLIIKIKRAQPKPMTPMEAITKLEQAETTAKASKCWELTQRIREATDRIREMEGIETIEQVEKLEDLEEGDRWSEGNE